MSYTALYRKFRPDTFEDVKGQDHIVTTLKNQIRADRIGHAFLFCGTRGTGKTTVAKILAKAVNCEQPVDGSPCNECPTCRAIQAGRSMRHPTTVSTTSVRSGRRLPTVPHRENTRCISLMRCICCQQVHLTHC